MAEVCICRTLTHTIIGITANAAIASTRKRNKGFLTHLRYAYNSPRIGTRVDNQQIPENISIETANELDSSIEVTCQNLYSSTRYHAAADHLVGSDGHHSVYDKNFVQEAGQSAERRATIRQGQHA